PSFGNGPPRQLEPGIEPAPYLVTGTRPIAEISRAPAELKMKSRTELPSLKQTCERKETDAAKSLGVGAQITFCNADPLFEGRMRARETELEELRQSVVRVGLGFSVRDLGEQDDAALEKIGFPSKRAE